MILSFSLEILFPSCQKMSKTFPILRLSLNDPSTFSTLTWPWPHTIVKDTIPCRQKAIPWTSCVLRPRIPDKHWDTSRVVLPKLLWCSINNMFLECHEATCTNEIPAVKALRSQGEYSFLNKIKLNFLPNPPLHAHTAHSLYKIQTHFNGTMNIRTKNKANVLVSMPQLPPPCYTYSNAPYIFHPSGCAYFYRNKVRNTAGDSQEALGKSG